MIVVALDLSLTSTGVAYGDTSDLQSVRFATIKTPSVMGARRLASIIDAIESYLDSVHPVLVAMEGYAMGVGRSGRVFDIGELGGVVKLTLFNRRIPYLIVPPSSLKLYVTGNGRAEKDEVMGVLKKWFKVKFKTSDEADAFGLFLLSEYRRKFLTGTRQWTGFDAECAGAKRKAIAGCTYQL